MDALDVARPAALLAAVVAGPPLYGLVQSGDLDTSGALARGGLVMGVIAAGLAALGLLVRSYQHELERKEAEERRLRAVETALDALDEARIPPPA